eukprot:1185946-Prorocentrum_minimum.AAC.1
MKLTHGPRVANKNSTVRGQVVHREGALEHREGAVLHHGGYMDVTWRGQRVCSAPNCYKAEGLEEPKETRFKLCGNCKRVQYCSKVSDVPSTRPVITSTRPAITSPRPAITSTRPAITSTRPAITSTRPAITSTLTVITSTRPAITSTRPAIRRRFPSVWTIALSTRNCSLGAPHWKIARLGAPRWTCAGVPAGALAAQAQERVPHSGHGGAPFIAAVVIIFWPWKQDEAAVAFQLQHASTSLSDLLKHLQGLITRSNEQHLRANTTASSTSP